MSQVRVRPSGPPYRNVYTDVPTLGSRARASTANGICAAKVGVNGFVCVMPLCEPDRNIKTCTTYITLVITDTINCNTDVHGRRQQTHGPGPFSHWTAHEAPGMYKTSVKI